MLAPSLEDLLIYKGEWYTMPAMGMTGFDREGWSAIAGRGASPSLIRGKHTSANNSYAPAYALAA